MDKYIEYCTIFPQNNEQRRKVKFTTYTKTRAWARGTTREYQGEQLTTTHTPLTFLRVLRVFVTVIKNWKFSVGHGLKEVK